MKDDLISGDLIEKLDHIMSTMGLRGAINPIRLERRQRVNAELRFLFAVMLPLKYDTLVY